MKSDVQTKKNIFLTSIIKSLHPKNSIVGSLALVLTAYLVTLFIIGTRGFWIADDATKFLQVRAILRSNYTNFSLSWPGAIIDPSFSYNPIPTPFSIIVNHRLYSIFSPFFALLSSIPFKYFGYPGLYLLPLIASLIMLIGVARITKTISPNITASHVAVLITGLCTPVWFYSVVFWEHIIAVCFCIWAVFYILRFTIHSTMKDLIVGSVLAALSVYFRDDMYVFCGVLVFSIALFTKDNKIKNILLSLLILVVSILPLWLFQWRAIGSPFGYHLGMHLFAAPGIGSFFIQRLSVFYSMIFASHPSRFLSFILVAPFIITFFLFPRLTSKFLYSMVIVNIVIAFICGVVYIISLSTARSPIAFLLEASNSLFVTAPIIILAFLHSGKDKADHNNLLAHRLLIIAVCYLLLYCMTAPKLGSTGIHWGNRFLLLFYPITAILGAINIIHWINHNAARRYIYIYMQQPWSYCFPSALSLN